MQLISLFKRLKWQTLRFVLKICLIIHYMMIRMMFFEQCLLLILKRLFVMRLNWRNKKKRRKGMKRTLTLPTWMLSTKIKVIIKLIHNYMKLLTSILARLTWKTWNWLRRWVLYRMITQGTTFAKWWIKMKTVKHSKRWKSKMKN